ncbi:MAG: iron ABC transporter permease [Rhodobacteraceae bacterium]|jgi:iron(III) transport system permease protein|nr:iron ABC transporter permease [Paracoccaceae bacterium]
MRPRLLRGEVLTLAALAVVAVALFVVPLVLLARVGLTDGDGFSLVPLAEALDSRSVRRALWNSIESASLSALFATAIGTAMALLIGLTDVRAKGAVVFALLLPMMIPPHVTAIAWIQALGPSSPVLRTAGLAPPPGSPNPLYSPGGVAALLTLQHMPLVLLVVLAALRALPREMAEAARLAGAGPARLLARVILPLIGPSLVAAFALAFVSALGNFGIQALLGIPARYTTLPVLIWQRLASFGPSVLADVAVISVLLAGLALAALAGQLIATRLVRTPITGPPQPPMRFRLGRARPLAEGALGLWVAASLVLPLAALVGTALVRTYGLPLNAETVTLDHFAEILLRQEVTARAFLNSSLAAGLAAALLASLSVALAYFLQTGRRRMARGAATGVAGLADMSYAIPGLVISVAFILAFIRPLPVLGISLYNTLWIIVAAYLTAFFAIALKPVAAAYGAIDPALDDAARVSGAGFFRRMRRIFGPIVAPAAAAGAILVFLTAYNEVTVSALLWSTGNETIGTTIFNYDDGGYTTLAAAMSTVTVAATVLLMAALHVFGRRLPPGVVPWRV